MRAILKWGNVSAEEWEEHESSIRRWGVSSVPLDLTERQVAALIERGRGWPWTGYELLKISPTSETEYNRNMEQITHIAESLRGILRLVVDYPDDVKVSPIEDGKGFVLEIMVAKRDVGKVIGKTGRTARALRNIIQAVSLTHKIPISLDIVNDAPQQEPMGVEANASSLAP